MSIEESFIKYKDITLTIIKTVKAEEYEKLDEIFAKRQLVLDDINKINCTIEELKKFYSLYETKKIEKELESEIKFKKVYLMKKIKENEQKQVGTAGYNNISAKAVFLSKQI